MLTCVSNSYMLASISQRRIVMRSDCFRPRAGAQWFRRSPATASCSPNALESTCCASLLPILVPMIFSSGLRLRGCSLPRTPSRLHATIDLARNLARPEALRSQHGKQAKTTFLNTISNSAHFLQGCAFSGIDFAFCSMSRLKHRSCSSVLQIRALPL
jgi:hypothetical protein